MNAQAESALGRTANTGASCIIVAEVAQTHDGSLGQAHAFIDAIARTGADAVKFQTHIADAESTPSEPWRVKFSRQDKSRYDYWKRMEFTEDQWTDLRTHADEKGLLFISSPFSAEAVELLTRVGVAAWKIASGEISNTVLFDRIAKTGLPIWLSTGMSSLQEIDEAVGRVRARSVPLILLQCSSMYPTPPEKVGLNMIPFFRDRYQCPTGLSDHSGTIYSGLAAATLGAALIEVHVTLSREMFGPDVPVSLTTSELAQLVEGVRWIETMLANPVNKDGVATELADMRKLFMKSVVMRVPLSAGTVLQDHHLTVKKPGSGIPPHRMPELVGRRLRRPVAVDHILQEEDLEA